MKNKMKLLCAFCVLLAALCACQLAQDYPSREEAAEDMLIGFFVTMDYYSLHQQLDPETGRLNAAREGSSTFTFPGIEGIPFFMATVPAEDWAEGRESGHNLVIFGETGAGIVVDDMLVSVSDDGVSHTLSGTLYVTPQSAGRVFTLHPVFQTADFAIYTIGGGNSVSQHSDSDIREGNLQSFRQAHSTTITENGVSHTRSGSIELTFAVMHPPERIVILQMCANNDVIARTEYAPNAVPDTMTLRPDTAYIIVETHRAAHLETPVLRALYGTDEEIEIFCERENGVLERQIIQLEQ